MSITNALVWGIVLFLTLIPFQANAESPRPVYPTEDGCQTPLSLAPGNWSEQERWVWDKRICLGKIADLSKRPRGENNACDLGKAEEWSQDRHISSQFIQTVLFHAPFRRTYIQSGFRLRCAIFPQKVDLSQGHFTREIWLDNSYFAQGLNASSLEIEGPFSLEGSRFQGPFKVELNDAKVGGDLKIIGSEFKGLFNAESLEVKRDLLLRQSEFEEINLAGAKVKRQFDAGSSTFQGPLIAYGLTVQSDLFLSKDTECGETECKETTFSNEVNLAGAKVGGLLNAAGSVFKGALNAERLIIQSDLFLRGGARFQTVNLAGVKIEGDFQLQGGTFAGKLDLTGAEINGELHLHQQGENPTWEIEKGGQPRLILRNASVGALNDSKDSWKNLDGRLELTGFTYKQMGGGQGKAGETMADRSAETLLAWLGMQPDFKKVYQPQPFQQLANTLRAAGYEDKANDIIVSAKNHRLCLPGTPLQTKVSLFLQKYLFNYGYDLIRPIWILLALLAVGTISFLLAYQLPESIKHTSPRQKMKYLIKHRV